MERFKRIAVLIAIPLVTGFLIWNFSYILGSGVPTSASDCLDMPFNTPSGCLRDFPEEEAYICIRSKYLYEQYLPVACKKYYENNISRTTNS